LTIERFGQFIDNIRKLGYDPDKAVRQLSTINDLEKERKQAEDQCNKAKLERDKEESRLNQLKKQTESAEANLNQINGCITKATTELTATLQKSKNEAHRIKFAEALSQLFGDISQVPPELLFEVMAHLNMIIETKLNPAAMYPIDYTEAKERALSLLEHALGKSLVRRETYDEMLHSTVQKYDDLMLDRLGKMERERDKLSQEKIQLAAEKRSLQDTAVEKVLQAALNLQAKGVIKIFKCKGCGRTMAFTVADSHNDLPRCPFCQASDCA
jgi:chromosome segregation ATPase